MKKKMLRWLGGLVVVVLLLVLAAPGGVGLMAEGRYKELWDNAVRNEPGIEAEVVAFDRGWFNSTATVELRFTDPTVVSPLVEMGWAESGDESETAVMRLEERVHHGPVPFTAPAPLTQRWKPGFAVVDSRLAENMPVDDDLGIENTLHLGLTGGITGKMTVSPLEVDLPETDARLQVDETMTLDYDASRGLDRVNARLRGGALRVLDEKGQGMAVEEPWLDISQRRGPAGLWVGGSELRLARVQLLTPQGPMGELAGLTWATRTSESDGLMEQNHEIHLKRATQGEFAAGPLAVDATFFNMKPEAIVAMQEALAEWPGPAVEGDEKVEPLLSVLHEPLMQLAGDRPGLRIDQFEVTLPGGDVDIDGNVQIAEMDRATLEERLAEPRWGRIVEGEARLRTSREIMRRSMALSMMGSLPDGEMEDNVARLMDMQIDSAAEQGLLEIIDDDIQARVRLEDGVLFMSDQEILRF